MAKRTSSKARRDSHPGPSGQRPTAAASGSGNPVLEGPLARGAGQRAAATYALLALLVALAFLPVLRNSFVNYDDPLYVTANQSVQNGLTWESIQWAFGGAHLGFWHPLTLLSHMLDCQLYGLRDWGHHLTSLGLHMANTLCLFAVWKRMTGAPLRSALVAALFALHPLHVESVAWVSERKEVLSGLFWMLTLWAYVRFVEGKRQQEVESDRHPKSRLLRHASTFYLLSLFFFLCALMSKPMVVTLPFVLLLLDYWPLRRNAEGRMENVGTGTLGHAPHSPLHAFPRLAWEKAPFFALAAVFSGITLYAEKAFGAVAYQGQAPALLRFANAVLAYVRYLRKALWPSDLAVFYPYPRAIPLWQVAEAAVFLLGITVWVLRLKRKPWLVVGWFWYLGTLVPVIGLIQVGSHSMADRYTYIPLIGLLVLATWGACDLTRHWRYQVPALAVTGAAAILLCLALTRQQLGHWHDSEALFRHALAVTVNNRQARINLGAALLQKGQTDEAIRQFQEALRLKPDDHEARNNLASALITNGQVDEAIRQLQEALRLKPDSAEALNNLANALEAKGQTDETIRLYQQSLRLKPDDAEAHYNLGMALGQKGQADEAIRQFREVLRLNPNYAEAHCNLGNLLRHQGQFDAAVAQYQGALRLKPRYAEAHYDLGVTLDEKGQTDEAVRQYEEALHLKPDYPEAHNDLGAALAGQGQADAAVRHFQEALRLKPDYAEACFNLATALGQKGQMDEAIRQFQTALRLKPDYAEAHNNLGMALSQQGRSAEAIGHFQEALRLKPDYADARQNLDRALATKAASPPQPRASTNR